MPRPRKANVRRDNNGKSRGEPHQIHPEVIAVRERQLRQDGIVLEFKKYEGTREVFRRTADDRLAGTSLGRLYLRWQQGERFHAISKNQFEAGEAWGNLVRRHMAIVYSTGPDPKSASFEIGGGLSTKETPEETIIYVRRKWSDCYNSLMEVCETHGLRVRDVTYGICVEDWPIRQLCWTDFGKLRIGLNSLQRVLDFHKKSVYGEMR